jgi:hypothetical protein
MGGLRVKRKYQFLDSLAVGDFVTHKRLKDRDSIRVTGTQHYGYKMSVKRMLDDKGRIVLKVERLA